MDQRRRASERTLEVTVLSCENPTVDGKPVTKNVCVVLRTESINSFATGMAAAEGGKCPSWNEKFSVNMPVHARSITFEVQCKTTMGVKSIGIARIALSDFLGGNVPEGYLQFLSYRLRDRDGRRSGIINFSVRVTSPEYSEPPVKPSKGTVVSDHCYGGLHNMRGGEENGNQVVIGIPVCWWNYPIQTNV
ncbi:hypothetical protein L6164_003824 [Bauhinia variegata]|uniref:Uncharacterized protein n=1 Tax=Bauhinia variegata TaxID=167791 RepID=A0ACB9Q336_BAUVA|nr:hypothetical protein L6164_003824 [Bauhinia variegata]